MRKTLFFLLLASSAAMFAENYTVKSPDERILVNVPPVKQNVKKV